MMRIEVRNLASSENLKMFNSEDRESRGFLLINCSKSDYRLLKLSEWKEADVKVLDSVVLKNGRRYENAVLFQLKISFERFNFVRKCVDAYLEGQNRVEDLTSFKTMYDDISKSFLLTQKELALSAQGVYGELKFIEYSLSIPANNLLNAWQNDKSRTLIDFNFSEDLKVEVKTYGLDGEIQFSSMSQLAPLNFPENYFTVFVEVRNSEESGESLKELYDKIRGKLNPSYHELFERRLNVCSDGSFKVLSNFIFETLSVRSTSMRKYSEMGIHPSIRINKPKLDIKMIDVYDLDYVLCVIGNSFDQ